MKRLLLVLAILCGAIVQANAQASVALYCWNPNGSNATNNQYEPCQAAFPLSVTGSITPSGTQNVNITQILGAPPSLTNPLWVFPATGATFPVSGSLTVTEPTTSNAASAALVANQVINAAPSSLYTFNVSADSTLSAAAWWIMIYNATTAPADGGVTPARCIAMSSGSTAYTGAFPIGLQFSTGIVIGVSTTGCFTKTASTHAYIAGDYK